MSKQKNWDPWGGRAPGTPPRSANGNDSFTLQRKGNYLLHVFRLVDPRGAACAHPKGSYSSVVMPEFFEMWSHWQLSPHPMRLAPHLRFQFRQGNRRASIGGCKGRASVSVRILKFLQTNFTKSPQVGPRYRINSPFRKSTEAITFPHESESRLLILSVLIVNLHPPTINTKTALAKWSRFLARCPTLYSLIYWCTFFWLIW